MTPAIEHLVRNETAAKGLLLDPTFFHRADAYIAKHFAGSSEKNRMIVESYLSQAAIRIAKSENKSRLEGEDFKAAVWLFHQPEQPDDPCIGAGRTALALEQQRPPERKGLLLESFARQLDRS